MKLLRNLLCPFYYCCCKSGTNESSATGENAEQQNHVCVYFNWNSFKRRTKKRGEMDFFQGIGETLTYLNESAIDSANPQHDYYHVKLTDGKIAWARSYGIALNA
jgi:hypothetical protein